jgi:hypothetical protein
VTVSVDTGTAVLPLAVNVCATNPKTGACQSTPVPSFPQTYAANTTQTYSVFLTAEAPIAFAPATSRVFLRFLDASGNSHGATSVAVQTN